MDFINRYERAIVWILGYCPGQDKFAHTYAGLIIWLAAAVALRKPFGSLLPIVIVIALETANECVDRAAHGSWRWHDTIGDAAATWFWPVVLTAALRWIPSLKR